MSGPLVFDDGPVVRIFRNFFISLPHYQVERDAGTRSETCAALLLILFAGYWCSITLFPHAHLVDGFVIVHSHPFSGAANGSAPQNHTPQQFQLIAHLSLLVMVAAVALSFAARLLGVCYVFCRERPVGCFRPMIRTFSLRAPPVC